MTTNHCQLMLTTLKSLAAKTLSLTAASILFAELYASRAPNRLLGRKLLSDQYKPKRDFTLRDNEPRNRASVINVNGKGIMVLSSPSHADNLLRLKEKEDELNRDTQRKLMLEIQGGMEILKPYEMDSTPDSINVAYNKGRQFGNTLETTPEEEEKEETEIQVDLTGDDEPPEKAEDDTVSNTSTSSKSSELVPVHRLSQIQDQIHTKKLNRSETSAQHKFRRSYKMPFRSNREFIKELRQIKRKHNGWLNVYIKPEMISTMKGSSATATVSSLRDGEGISFDIRYRWRMIDDEIKEYEYKKENGNTATYFIMEVAYDDHKIFKQIFPISNPKEILLRKDLVTKGNCGYIKIYDWFKFSELGKARKAKYDEQGLKNWKKDMQKFKEKEIKYTKSAKLTSLQKVRYKCDENDY